MATVLPLLSAVTASTTGSAFEVLAGRDVTFVWAYTGPGGAGAVGIEVSLDGTFWFPAGVTPNYNNVPVVLTYPVRFVRASYDDQGHSGTMDVQALQSDEDG